MESPGNLEVIAMKRLKCLLQASDGRETVPFDLFHASLLLAMRVSQAEAWDVLKSMEYSGLVEIDPFDEIKLCI